MIQILSEKIHDNRFLRLLRNMLKAGYLEDWVWNATLSGAPQGGVLSPLLSNIYLHRLDAFVEEILMPEYNRGVERVKNPAYRKVQKALARARERGDRVEARSLRQRLRGLPSKDPRIRATGGCGTAATPTTTCSVSPGQRPKPRRSSNDSDNSCVMNSGWNCRKENADHSCPHQRGTIPQLRDHRSAERPGDHQRPAVE